jgi:hypothetical protein
MKKYLFLSIIALFVISCSNEVQEVVEQKPLNNDKVVNIISYDSLQILASKDFAVNNPDFQAATPNANMLRATLGTTTVSGYSSTAVINADYAVMYGPGPAGSTSSPLPSGLQYHTLYIIDICEFTKEITLPAGAFAYIMDSPLCGFNPLASGRGYAATTVGNKFIMKTRMSHVKYDVLGRTINVWLPGNGGLGGNPNALSWNYGYVIP